MGQPEARALARQLAREVLGGHQQFPARHHGALGARLRRARGRRSFAHLSRHADAGQRRPAQELYRVRLDHLGDLRAGGDVGLAGAGADRHRNALSRSHPQSGPCAGRAAWPPSSTAPAPAKDNISSWRSSNRRSICWAPASCATRHRACCRAAPATGATARCRAGYSPARATTCGARSRSRTMPAGRPWSRRWGARPG